MKHTPLSIIAIFSLALVGCGNTQAQEEPTPAPTETVEEQPMEQDAAEAETEDLTPEQEARRDAMLNDSNTANHGTYRVHAVSGTELEFQLPADLNHEAVAEIESLRQELGIEPVTYIVADIDNRQGDTLAALPQISVFDEAGTEYEFHALPYALPEWEPEYDDSDHYWDTYDRLNELEDAHHDTASPAGVGSTVLIYQGDDLPDEFTRVATWPNGAAQSDDAYQAE